MPDGWGWAVLAFVGGVAAIAFTLAALGGAFGLWLIGMRATLDFFGVPHG